MIRPGTFQLTALLALLTGLGPLSMDMYLASLPDIGRLLGAPSSQVQLTISSYLVGFAIGQVFYGPMSDRHGRRPIFMAALALYIVATAACALAPTIEFLIGARVFQAIGGAGSVVLARAVVRDLYDGVRVGRELSRLASVMALAPIAAPMIGGLLQSLFGWRSNFILLTGIGIAAAAMVWFLFSESLRQRAPEPVSIVSTFRSYREFLRNPSFAAHLGITTTSFLGLFAWISTAAFVLQDLYGISALAFGFTFAISSAGYLVGTTIAARFVGRWGIDRTMSFGCLAMAGAGIVMVAALALGFRSPVALIGPMLIYLTGLGLAMPQAQAGALLPFPHRAGAASSLMGLVQQTAAALLGAFLGHVLGTTAWPLAIAVAGAGILTLAVWAATRRVRRAQYRF